MFKLGRKTQAALAVVIAIAYGALWFHLYPPQSAPAVAAVMTVPPAVHPLEPPKSYRCQKVNHLLSVDGRGDDPAWEQASWTDYFVDIEGDKKPRPRFATRAKMLWNDQYLYVYALLQEPDVRATITQKNSVIFHDNDFEVFIDPESSGENYYEYEMNALNTIWELTLVKRYTKGGPAIWGTNLQGLVSSVFIDGTLNDPGNTDRGWSVEIAFPFKGLATHRRNGPCPPVAGDQWRINFSRVEWMTDIVDGKYQKQNKPEDNWVWSPQGIIDMHQPEHWGYLRFVQ